MKEINVNEMSKIEGGYSAASKAGLQVFCFALGAITGEITFGLGFVLGVGCSMMVDAE